MSNIHETNDLANWRGIVRRLVTPLSLAAAIIVCCGMTGMAGDKADREEAPADQDVERAEEKSPRQEAEPKLSFTDEDLKKYQRPKRGTDGEDAAVLEGIEVEGEVTPAAAPQGAPLVRTPITIAKPPADDPLKEYKDREAREKFRAQQVETLRDRIAGLEKRLAYLQQKRLAIIDPLRIMPQPQGADESASEAGLGSSELLAAVEAEIESTEASLQSARDNLVTIQTRFGAEGR